MRMLAKKVCVKRPDPSHGLYKMSSHAKSVRNPIRENLLFSSIKRMNHDGLSNMKQLNAKIEDVKHFALFTHLKINVGKQPPNYYVKFGNTSKTDNF